MWQTENGSERFEPRGEQRVVRREIVLVSHLGDRVNVLDGAGQ